jgi:hypothetical protein
MSAVRQIVEPIAVEARPRQRRDQISTWGPCLVVAAVTVATGVSGMRGADYPGHYVRALVWEGSGAWAWSNLWYAGHSTVPYSVLAPALMSWIGPFALAAIGSLAATYLFARLTVERVPSSTTVLANHAFALAMAVNVVVGRAPFAFGLALALLAVLAWTREHTGAALAAAVVAPMVSPVAGAFLAMASASVAIARGSTFRRTSREAQRVAGQAVAMTAAAAMPVALVTMLFGDSGWFPFRGGHFAATLITLTLVATIPRRTVRVGAAVAIITAAVVFVVPNPLGGNFVRLPQIVAVPLAVAAVPAVRKRWRALFAVVVAAGVVWSVHPGVVAAVDWWGDDSIEGAYHQPLIDEVRRRNRDGEPIGRLEVPFTENHWESLFVAPEVPFARGWERQIDLDRNEPLYDEDLTSGEYRAWLLANGVRWIAIPDVSLDHAGQPEQRAIDGAPLDEIGWLTLVWSNDDWRLFEIDDYVPIVEAPAELIVQGTDSLIVRTPRQSTVTIRYRYTDYLTITGAACVAPDGHGWIVAELPAAGEYRLAVDPVATWLGTAADQCA